MARRSLAVCTLLLLAVALLIGAHSSSLDRLKAALSTGSVRTVWVSGGLPTGATGYSTVEVRWREGLFNRHVRVLQVRGPRASYQGAGSDVSAVITSGVASQLVEANPDVRVIREEAPRPSASILRWEVPAWLGFAALILLLAAVGMLVSGPKPWRATRWAWFWLMVSPVGTLAYLVLSGPTPLVPAPRNLTHRLTGGWAFLLTLPLSALLIG